MCTIGHPRDMAACVHARTAHLPEPALDSAMCSLFCPLEEDVGHSILTMSAQRFVFFLWCVLKFSLEDFGARENI
jgi:hypothetical protein